MSDKLLPPNPEVSAAYWLHVKDGPRDFMGWWAAEHHIWTIEGCALTPNDAAKWGHTLAGRHPIPGPAALDRLHSPTPEMMAVGEQILDTVGDLSEVFDAMLANALRP